MLAAVARATALYEGFCPLWLAEPGAALRADGGTGSCCAGLRCSEGVAADRWQVVHVP